MAEQQLQVGDCKERVAFDLMLKIAAQTADDSQRSQKTFWITLYRQCYKVVNGSRAAYALEEDS